MLLPVLSLFLKFVCLFLQHLHLVVVLLHLLPLTFCGNKQNCKSQLYSHSIILKCLDQKFWCSAKLCVLNINFPSLATWNNLLQSVYELHKSIVRHWHLWSRIKTVCFLWRVTKTSRSVFSDSKNKSMMMSVSLYRAFLSLHNKEKTSSSSLVKRHKYNCKWIDQEIFKGNNRFWLQKAMHVWLGS